MIIFLNCSVIEYYNKNECILNVLNCIFIVIYFNINNYKLAKF